MTFKRILLPTDFSTTAHRALSFAAHLAAQHDAVLHILHVRTPAEEREQPPRRRSTNDTGRAGQVCATRSR